MAPNAGVAPNAIVAPKAAVVPKVGVEPAPAAQVPPLPTVPSIIGQTCAQARRTLEAAKLRLGQCEVGEATGRIGTDRINVQQPGAGAPYPRAAPLVNARVEPRRDDAQPVAAKVPDVVGLAAPDAQQRVLEAKLRPSWSIAPLR